MDYFLPDPDLEVKFSAFTKEIAQPFAIIRKVKQRKATLPSIGGSPVHMKNWQQEFSFFYSLGCQMAAKDFSWEEFVNLINFEDNKIREGNSSVFIGVPQQK